MNFHSYLFEYMKEKNKEANYLNFMLESNRIEGENKNWDNDLGAVEFSITTKRWTVARLLKLHSIVGGHIVENWVGKFRNVQVYVGNSVPPKPEHVEMFIQDLLKKQNKLDSWEFHNEFEKIHPFKDLNGRMGRLLWLNKAVKEGYDFSIPFLQKYYYQSISKYNFVGVR